MATRLIAGCGYVGDALLDLCNTRQDSVYAIRRHIPKDDSRAQWIAADLAQIQSQQLPEQLDYVVYMVGASEHTEAGYQYAYIDALSALIDALKAKQFAGRFVFISSTGVYGQTDGVWVDEQSLTEPSRFTGEIMLQAEHIVRQSGLDTVILRCAGIYGPGRERLLRRVIEGQEQLTDYPRYTNRVHREDVARAIEHVWHLNTPEPVYNVMDDDPCDKNDFIRWVAAQFDVSLTTTDDATLSRNKRCSNQLLKSSGFEFSYPSFREGYQTTIAKIAKEMAR